MIINKTSILAQLLDTNITYEHTIYMEKPGEMLAYMREGFRISANGYETIYLPTYQQVLDLTVDKFIKDK
jgi:hypothetical protein